MRPQAINQAMGQIEVFNGDGIKRSMQILQTKQY